MPIIPFIVIGIIILSVFSAKKQEQQKNAARQSEAAARRQAVMATENSAQKQTVSDAERARRQEELKRRLQENAARREAERARGIPTAPAKPAERRPLERTAMQSTLQKERPIVAHEDDDCGGGSIHDGYHEGVTQFAGRAEASVAGKLGHRLADEDERIEKEAEASENAKKAMARIAKLPPLAQGMVFAEILGKPKSETA